jgi:hypothetical protein
VTSHYGKIRRGETAEVVTEVVRKELDPRFKNIEERFDKIDTRLEGLDASDRDLTQRVAFLEGKEVGEHAGWVRYLSGRERPET